jgi:FkbM family methyltransferase
LINKDLTDTHIALQVFSGYKDEDLGIFSDFHNPDARPQAGFITDFLGCRTRTSFLWQEARRLDGRLLPVPVPGDYHAETIEWIGLLKAVRSAQQQYVAMELGAGFGTWTVAGGAAARSRQIKNIRLYAVEGDPEHFNCLRQHFIDNGFDPAKHKLLQAAVGASAGVASWPVLDAAASYENWGLRPMGSTHDYTGRRFQKTIPVTVLAMKDLLLEEPSWDLVHIDVQGEEVAICRSAIEELNARVRWLIIGTHSRKLDGDLLELLGSAGWILENEKPSKFTFTPHYVTLEALTTLDGTQVWRNPRLAVTTEFGALSSFSQIITSPDKHLELPLHSTYALAIDVTNSGRECWSVGNPACPVTVGYRWMNSAGSILPVEGNRAQPENDTVPPGQSIRIQLPVQAPDAPGSYTLLVSMVQEGVAWFMDRGAEPLAVPTTVSQTF